MKKNRLDGFILLMRVFFAYLIGGKFQKTAEAELHLFQAKMLFSQKRWELAWKKFIMAESLQPQNPEIQYFLAATYTKLKRYDYALEHIKIFSRLPEKSRKILQPQLDILEATISSELGKKDDSKNILKRYIEDKKIEAKLDREKENEIKKDKAEELREKQIKALAFRNLGNMLFKEKSYDEAINHYNKALELEEDSELYFIKGFVEFARGDYKKAIEEFNKAIDKGFRNEEIFFKRAYAHLKLGELKLARANFRTLIIDYPEGHLYNNAMSFLDTIKSF